MIIEVTKGEVTEEYFLRVDGHLKGVYPNFGRLCSGVEKAMEEGLPPLAE